MAETLKNEATQAIGTDSLKDEQRQAINAEGGNVAVSASAGSGKTFVMIKRLIRLVLEGKAKVNRILASTFTEAAASDMKEKLKRALRKEIENGRTELADQLADAETADICTLHSFCARLIRNYFYCAGVSPDFAVADESVAESLKKDAVNETFREFYVNGDEKAIAFCDRYKYRRSDSALKETIVDIYDRCHSREDPLKTLNAFRELYTVKSLNKAEKDFSEYIVKECGKVTEKVKEIKAELANSEIPKATALCDEFIAMVNDWLAGFIKDPFAERAKPSMSSITFPRKISDRVLELKNELQALSKFFKDVLCASAGGVKRVHNLDDLSDSAQTFSRMIGRYGKIYAEKKRKENLLDFNDLETFALKALSDEKVRTAVREKYKYVFVDEYQDVNPVQEKIIRLVSDGNLFMVGDVKQSIYGFRGCRSDIFEKNTETADISVRLNYNFRSAENVIKMVNGIFSYCYRKDLCGLDYSATATLKAGGIYPADKKGRAEIHRVDVDKEEKTAENTPRIYDVWEEAFSEKTEAPDPAASCVADIIADECGKTYYDPKDEREKRIGYSDIAILTRRGEDKATQKLVKELTARNIPVVSRVSQNVLDYPEIQALTEALKLTDCFKSDIPLATVMLSPVGGFCEEDLAEIVRFSRERGVKGGFCDHYSEFLSEEKSPLAEKVRAFDDYIGKLRFLAPFKGAKGVLDKIISDCGYENYILAKDDGDVAMARLRKYLSETVTAGRVRTVREFLKRTEQRKAFTYNVGGEEDAVQVMTIHASKGLEFPVVIVFGLEQNFSLEGEKKRFFDDPEQGFLAESFDDQARERRETVYRYLAKKRARERGFKEEMHVFYVATTRATYSLHLVFSGKDDRKDKIGYSSLKNYSFADLIPKSMPITEYQPVTAEEEDGKRLADVRRSRRTVIVGERDNETESEMRERYGFIYPYAADSVLPLKTSVTAAVAEKKENDTPVPVIFAETDGEKTDREKGITAHRIMELIDFNGDFDAQLKKIADGRLILPESLAGVNTERVRRAVNAIKDGLKDKKLFREQDFICDIPAKYAIETQSNADMVLQGVIDLLAISEDGAYIYDYKYSALDGKSLKLKYKKQLDLYALATEKILKVKVLGKTLVNLFTGEIAVVD